MPKKDESGAPKIDSGVPVVSDIPPNLEGVVGVKLQPLKFDRHAAVSHARYICDY